MNTQERRDYIVTVHAPDCRILIGEDMAFDEAYRAMANVSRAYRKSGLNPVDAGADYRTFTAPTGEMIGLWMRPLF